jgi:hypothetical protein
VLHFVDGKVGGLDGLGHGLPAGDKPLGHEPLLYSARLGSLP